MEGEEVVISGSTERTEMKVLRLHVSGLPGAIKEIDLEDRFKSFGNVLKVDLIPHPFEENTCRGFAYVNLETSNEKLSRCMNVLNGCSWKGGKLQISMAKPDRFKVLEDGTVSIELANGPVAEDKYKRKMLRRKKRKLVRHSSDFSTLVTDKNVDKKKNWRRGRYGRAIACLRIRRPNRQLLIVDPSHYKNNLEKLFGSIKPKPLYNLTWTITDIIDDVADEDSFETISDVSMMDGDQEEEEEVYNEIEADNDHIADEVEVNQDEDVVMTNDDTTSNIALDEATRNDVLLDIPLEEEAISVPLEEDSISAVPLEDEAIDVSNTKHTEDEVMVVDETEPSPSHKEKESDSVEPNFEVNVNWSTLFSTNSTVEGSATSSLFGSLIDPGKLKNVSTDELFFKKPTNELVEKKEASESIEVVPVTNAVHNYSGLFADLNRITPTTATRFGMHLSRKEELLQDWRVERIELKEDFKKRLSEGKRRNKRIGGVKNMKFEGVGLATSQRLLAQSSIHQFCRISELSERQVIKLKGLLQPMMEAQKQEKLMKLKAAKSIPRPILPS